jgi:hypothetical protein
MEARSSALEDHTDYRRRSRLKKSSKDTLVGTWVQVSLDTVSADGTRRPLYGENAKGMIIYTSDGYFTLMQASVDLPKLKSAYPQKRRLKRPRPWSPAPSPISANTR